MKNGAAQVLEYVPFGTFQLPHVVFHVVLVAQSKKSHSLGPGKLLYRLYRIFTNLAFLFFPQLSLFPSFFERFSTF